MSTKALSIAGLVVALALLFAVNILTSSVFTAARVDLTENRLFTLSDGTRNILSGLQEPITIRLYLSERLVRNLPAINSYATRIKSLLDEYARASDGVVEIHVIDPEPFSEEEDRAVGFGLTGVPLDGGEEKLYMGWWAATPSMTRTSFRFSAPAASRSSSTTSHAWCTTCRGPNSLSSVC